MVIVMTGKLAVQLVGLAGTVLILLSFQCRSNKRLFGVQLAAYLCYTAHMLLLGAVSGGLSYMINAVRSFCLGGKKRFLNSRGMCVILCVLQACVLAVSREGWLSLLPVAANIVSTVAGYTHNPRKVRLAALFINSPLWVVYDVFVGSWAGILDEAVTMGSVIVSGIRYGWKEMDRTET